MSNNMFVFTDECGAYEKNRTNKALKAHPYYVRSNFIISMDDYNELEENIKKAKADIGLQPYCEIKWDHFGSLIKGRNIGIDITVDQIKRYFYDVVGIIQKYKSTKLFYTVTKLSDIGNVDKVKLIKMHMQNAFQKVQMDAESKNSRAIIVADDLNSENKKLKQALYSLTTDGDNYFTYTNIYKGLFVDYSDQCCGLQMADLCAGIFTATLKYLDASEHDKNKYMFAYELFDKYLINHVRKDDRNLPYYTVYGYGVKEVPNGCGKNEVKRVSEIIEKRLYDDLLQMIECDNVSSFSCY